MWRNRRRRARPVFQCVQKPLGDQDIHPDLWTPVQFDSSNYQEQSQSPLFNLPAEIRALIFHYTLRPYERADQAYSRDTVWHRPGHRAKRTADATFLRTCQRAYHEAWFEPIVSSEVTLYLTEYDRQPDGSTAVQVQLPTILPRLAARHGYTELDSVQIVPQLWKLEPGSALQEVLDWDDFHPRRITITLRHSDWWFWETDAPLHIGAQWVNECRFPNSLRELRLELETLQRKKKQVESIAARMRDRWSFERKDGVRLVASRDEPFSSYTWSGSSTLRGYRWLMDETRPETLDYHVMFVSFRPVPKSPEPEPEQKEKEKEKEEDLSMPVERPRTKKVAPDLTITDAIPLRSWPSAISPETLQKFKIPPGTSAEEVLRLTGGQLGDQPQ